MSDKLPWGPQPPPPTHYQTLEAAEHLLRVAGANLIAEIREDDKFSPTTSKWFVLADTILELFPQLADKNRL